MKNLSCANKNLQESKLTHFQPMFHFYIPRKHQKTFRFSDVFREYRSGTSVENGLIILHGNDLY